MRLTPLEIRKHTFARKRLGGVDPEEVQDFLNLVANEMEEIKRENTALKDRVNSSDRDLTEYKAMEETLRRTLVHAEKISTESEDHAHRESELIIHKAHLRAERVLDDARARLRQLSEEIDELQKRKDVFVHRFRSLVNMQLELLSQHDGDDDIGELAQSAHQIADRYAPIDRGDDATPSLAEVSGSRAVRAVGEGATDAPLAEDFLGLGSEESDR